MAHFVFESMDRKGTHSGGTIEADSISAAAHAIRSRGHVVISIAEQEAKSRKSSRKGMALRSIRQREIAEFCRRLATLLKAGVGVAEGLQTIGEAQGKGRFRRTILKMAERIRSGYSLSETMEEHAEAFPPIAWNMVAAAEASGELPAILLRLAAHIEKRLQIRENVMMALLYPCIVLFLTLCVLILMLAWVFPKLSDFLHSQQKELPVMAQVLLDVAAFASSQGATIAAVLLGLVLLGMLLSKTGKGRLLIHRALLKLPVLGKVFRCASTQVWTRTLSDLLRSGLSLQQALKVTAQVVPNQHYSNLLNRVCDQIVAGMSFGDALQRSSPLFDNLICKLVVVGENSGTLEDALDEIAHFAEDDLNRRVTVLSKLFEPAVIVVVGVVVGIVFITCFQTIYAYLPNG